VSEALSRQVEVFERQAGYCEGRSPLYAELCRTLAEEPRIDDIAPDLTWDFPLRLLSGLHYLVLGGEASWDDVGAALDEHGEFLTRWTSEQDVQTNEVQRSWALLPAFLSVADGRPLDLLELGSSGGLNLVWDRYRYVYRHGEWGSGTLVLHGDDRSPPPAALLERDVAVARHRGIDLSPVDVTSKEGARLLRSFVWADQTTRLDRLDRAIDLVRRDPPPLMEGDYVEALPSLLRNRRPGAQLVVFQTASTMYLDRARSDRVRAAFVGAAAEEPIVFITAGRAPDDDGFSLEVHRYPDESTERLAVFDFHGEWLDWGR
jgi:hypothetical protein